MTHREGKFNIGTSVGRGAELAETLKMTRMDIAAFHEGTKNQAVRLMEMVTSKTDWDGEEMGRSGVGLMMREDLTESAMQVTRVNECRHLGIRTRSPLGTQRL